MIENNKISDHIPLTELLLPMQDKIRNLSKKGTYMMFMNGVPNFPFDANCRTLIDLFKAHYPWVLEHPNDKK